MPAYRPSAVLRFAIRLDEGGSTAGLIRELQPITPAARSGISLSSGTSGANASHTVNARRTQLNTLLKLQEKAGQSSEPMQREIERARAQLKQAQKVAASATEVPDAISGPAPDALSLATIGGVPVLRCDVQRNGFRTMDSSSFTLNYFEAPFDPRLMRAAAVEVSMGVIAPLDHDAGMHGIRRADGSLLSQVEDPDGFRAGTRFYGFVSRWDIDFGESGATVVGEAKDSMSLIHDTPLPKEAQLDLDLPLELGVRALLDSFPALRGIPVRFGDGERGPVPGSAGARKTKLVGKKGKKRHKRVGENTNVWDYITDVCVATGVIPVIESYGIHLVYARTLYGKRPEAPSMVWGRNIESLRFSRAMAGFKNPTVEVRSYQADKQQTLAARYPASAGYETAIIGVRDFPKTPDRAARVTPSGTNPDEPIRVVAISGAADFDRLRTIARGIYEETARQEIEGSFETKDPSSFGVDFLEADLLDLKAGDPIRILFDARKQGVLADNVTLLQGMSVADRVRHLEDVCGFKRQVAVTYAALLDQTNMQTIFRTQAVRLGFDADEGLSVSVEFANYITVRDDASRADDVTAGPSAAVALSTGGQSGLAARRSRLKSSSRRTANAQAATDLSPAATQSQSADDRHAAGVQSQLQSDPDQNFSK